MNTSKMYYKIFDCCKVVEGPTRCIIYDLQRKKYYSVSKYLNTFLEKIGIHEVNSTAYNNTDQELINYLLSKEILFVMDECLINQFPASDETWLYPAHITNAIITLSKPFCFNLEFLLTQLDEIICRDIVFIFDGYLPSIKYLDEIYKSFEGSLVKTSDLFIPYSTEEVLEAYKGLTDKYNRISSIFIYGAPDNLAYKSSVVEPGNIFLQKSALLNTNEIPNITPDHFSLNGDLYRESLMYNTFFNRKIFLDQMGNVFNAPNSLNSYGNLSAEPILKIIDKVDFQKYWPLKKGIIDVCRECEFRYMCVDSRIPVQRKNGEWFHSYECNYNPYIAKWKGDDDYKTLQESGVVCNNDEFKKTK
jgi:SPASM domain peptide maturase of grasp-with-spasm system